MTNTTNKIVYHMKETSFHRYYLQKNYHATVSWVAALINAKKIIFVKIHNMLFINRLQTKTEN